MIESADQANVGSASGGIGGGLASTAAGLRRANCLARLRLHRPRVQSGPALIPPLPYLRNLSQSSIGHLWTRHFGYRSLPSVSVSPLDSLLQSLDYIWVTTRLILGNKNEKTGAESMEEGPGRRMRSVGYRAGAEVAGRWRRRQ